MRDVVARAVLQWLAVPFALGACASVPTPTTRFDEILSKPPPTNLSEKIRPPTGECLAQANAYGRGASELLPAPLTPTLDAHTRALIDGLHPIAKSVLARTRGIWFAENIPRAAAVFLPCDIDPKAATGGFVLIDVGQFPLDQNLADARVPELYWQALGEKSVSWSFPSNASHALDEGEPEFPNSPGASRDEMPVGPDAHAIRYLVLHELGHVLSLLAGEFALDSEGRIEVSSTRGFVGYSWRLMTIERKYLPRAGEGPIVQAVVPRTALDTYEWGSILHAQGADAGLVAPGYALHPARSPLRRARDVCSLVTKLPEAGFVTPTAARYPTEDFAEMFAHAILKDEGKLTAKDAFTIELPECGAREIRSPYFSPGVSLKREYIEHVLGLD